MPLRSDMPNNQNIKLNLTDGTVLTPQNLECSACFVPAGARCATEDELGPRSVDWFHYARESALREIARSAGLQVIE